MGSVAILVFDGYADWEPALALAGLREHFGVSVTSYGLSTAPVESMGGLRVQPDAALDAFDPAAHRLLILPGGELWTGDAAPEIGTLLTRTIAAGSGIAAICGATVAPARAGLLDDRAHTSNRLDFLVEHAGAAYSGQAYYRDQATAVADRGVITAPGTAPVAFAAAIFRQLVPERAAEVATFREMYAREHKG